MVGFLVYYKDMENEMKKVRWNIFLTAFFVLLLVGILNIIAYIFYFYWTLHYFDTLVHFLAGVSVGFASVWFFTYKNRNDDLGRFIETWNKKRIIKYTLLSGFIIGFLWEIFEILVQATSFSDGIKYVTDTSLDLFVDTLGSVLAGICCYVLFVRMHNR
jgi:magnesium-transporting ATPase (P-type)